MPKKTSAKVPASRGKAGKHHTVFAAAAHVLANRAELGKFVKDPEAYIRPLGLTKADVKKTSKKLKAIAKKNDASIDWW